MPGYQKEDHPNKLQQHLHAYRLCLKQLTKKLKLELTIANCAKSILETPGEWASGYTPNTEAYKVTVDKILLEILDRRQERLMEASKRKAPDTWHTSEEKRQAQPPTGNNRGNHRGQAGGGCTEATTMVPGAGSRRLIYQ